MSSRRQSTIGFIICVFLTACAGSRPLGDNATEPSMALLPAGAENIALGKPASASGWKAGSGQELAVDGDPATFWNAGGLPPQWIEIDLQASVTIYGIRLRVSQSPSGDTVHRVWGKREGEDFGLVCEFRGATQDDQSLERVLATPLTGIRYVRVETTASPAWVAWKEIEVLGEASPVAMAKATDTHTATSAPPATQTPPAAGVIFYNATVVTMDESRPTARAVALQGDKILAVGSNEEVLALKGPATRLIDLQGYTVLPGFIDSHAHRLGDVTLRNFAPSVEAAIQDAIQMGWTGVHELFVTDERLKSLKELDQQGKLSLRTAMYLTMNFDYATSDWWKDYRPRHRYSDRLMIAGLKITLDREWGEQIFLDQAALDAIVLEAHQRGWQIATHAFALQTHELILNAYEAALAGQSNDAHRHRIEHAAIVNDEQLARMARLGIIASVQLNGTPGWPDDETFKKSVPPEQFPWVGRFRDMLEAGVFLIGNTDAPWGTMDWRGYGKPEHKGSPFEAIYEAVTRIGYGGRQPEAWQLTQLLTVEEALRLLTINGAYATFEEKLRGSLEAGKWADLVIASGNPLTAPVDEIPALLVLVTVIGGRAEYCAQGWEAICP